MGHGYMMGRYGKELPQLSMSIKCESHFAHVYVNDTCGFLSIRLFIDVFIYLIIYLFCSFIYYFT